MSKPLEYTQTLNYLITNAKVLCNQYQATIYQDDVLEHHYLLSSFTETAGYLDWHITLEVNGSRHCLPIFTDIVQNEEDTLTFIFNQKVNACYLQGGDITVADTIKNSMDV